MARTVHGVQKRSQANWSLNGLERIASDQGHFALARTLYAESIRILTELTINAAEGLEGLTAVMQAQSDAPQKENAG